MNKALDARNAVTEAEMARTDPIFLKKAGLTLVKHISLHAYMYSITAVHVEAAVMLLPQL